MNDLFNAELRVGDRLRAMVREAEMERRARLGRLPSSKLTARLAGALRGAADLLEAAPGGAQRTAAASVRNSARGSAGA